MIRDKVAMVYWNVAEWVSALGSAARTFSTLNFDFALSLPVTAMIFFYGSIRNQGTLVSTTDTLFFDGSRDYSGSAEQGQNLTGLGAKIRRWCPKQETRPMGRS